MKKNNIFFKDDKQRDLWIHLNAKLIMHVYNAENDTKINDLGGVDKRYTPLWISNNQLTYDEINSDAPRFSLEQLSSMDYDDLVVLSQRQKREKMKKFLGDVDDLLREDE